MRFFLFFSCSILLVNATLSFFLFTAMGRILDAAAVVLLPGLGYGIPYSWLTVA